MKETTAPTLSAHLLRQAARFLSYPTRVYRTRTNLRAQEMFDGWMRKAAEWRKTFASPATGDLHEVLTTPGLLDELYCRDLLRAIPEMVDRTRSLASLTLEGDLDGEAFVYLREAANCYIYGLPQAAVALARAAVEASLRKRTAKYFGKEAIAAADLKKLIQAYATRGKLLSREGLALARKVQVAGNKVLHGGPTDSQEALAVFEAARRVILELGGRPAKGSRGFA